MTDTPKKTLTINRTITTGTSRQTSKREVKVEVRRRRLSPSTTPSQSSEDVSKIKELVAAAEEQDRAHHAQKTQAAQKKLSTPQQSQEISAPSLEKQHTPHAQQNKDHRHASPLADEETARPSKRQDRDRRQTGKLTISKALIVAEAEDGDTDIDLMERRQRSLSALRRAREKEKQKHSEMLKATDRKVTRDIVVPETITVQELANRMSERSSTVIKTLMNLGVMATINQIIDADTAELVAGELGHKIRRIAESDIETGLHAPADLPDDLQPRPPVVTIMGHVDHGKTSLLDALRSSDVVSGEAGGITQHIGAYQVTAPSGSKITFIDTPGHEAFSAMRARGAHVTDIIVLVVAANDGVKPQTVEAIDHAKAAQVPLLIAINKTDLPDAQPQRVRQELLQYGIVVESMSGDILDVEVSAKQKKNLNKLEEAILLQAEMLSLKANPTLHAEGTVIEAHVSPGQGSVATVLVQRGTLHVGDIFVTGSTWGRVRALFNDHGQAIDSASPSMPVAVLGLQGTPEAGNDFIVVENEARAREVASYRARKSKEARLVVKGQTARPVGTMEAMLAHIKAGTAHVLPVLVKADVQGSAEALSASLEKISTEKARINVLRSAVGGINESDVTLAKASHALIIGFNVRANPKAKEVARQYGVDIRYYSIIYDAIDDIKKALVGLLPPEIKEHFIGYADVKQVFKVGKGLKAAGCVVSEGTLKKGCKVRVLRDDVVVFEGKLAQLKHLKDDVKEAKEGTECGLSFENYNDLSVGDRLECFDVEEIQARL